jgi:hypothetical protein
MKKITAPQQKTDATLLWCYIKWVELCRKLFDPRAQEQTPPKDRRREWLMRDFR